MPCWCVGMTDRETISVTDYHDRTKHRFDAYARGPQTIDWEAQPDSFRRFDGATLQALPLLADDLNLPFAALFDAAPVAPLPLAMESVARLLEISLALSAWKQFGAARWSLRCNPSSGNLHPTEAYLVSRGIAGLTDGVHHYRPDVHGLELRCAFTSAQQNIEPLLLLGLSSVHWREAWKYGERAFRYCQHDVGHALAGVSYAAAVLGWRVQPLFEVGDDALAHLLGLDRTGEFVAEEGEHPDLLLAILPDKRATDHLDGLALLQSLQSSLEQGDWAGQANVLDRRHFYRWPVIDAVTQASHKPDLDVPMDTQLPQPLSLPIPSLCTEPAARLFRQRRSAQAFDGVTGIEATDFFRLLDHLLPRPGIAPWDTLPWAPRVHPVLFVHRVQGLAPGLYALPRSEQGKTLLRTRLRQEFSWSAVAAAPDHLPLFQLIVARTERTAMRLSCHQEIAGASAFSLGLLAEFDSHIQDTPWRYRELFWEAGVLGQVLYLEAEACGLRGTGIGCYFDDAVHEVLGITDHSLQSLYHFTIGGPVMDARLVSLPPYERR